MEQFRNLDTQSQVAMVVAVALVANVHLKLVALPSALVGLLRQNKTLLALATVGLAYYDLKMGVVAASLLYVSMNTKEGMAGDVSEVESEKGILDTVMETVGLAPTEPSTPTVEEAVVAKEEVGEVSGMMAKPSMEPSANPLPTQVNLAPSADVTMPESQLTPDVDETKFDQMGVLPKVSESTEVMGWSGTGGANNLASP